MASQNNLHLQWLQKDNILTGQPLHLVKHALQIFTHKASTEGWGAHLNERTAKGAWSLSTKQSAYQLPRTRGSFSSFKSVPRPLSTQDGTGSKRQHHSGVTHKQGRRHEFGATLCFTMENLVLVHQKSSNSQARHIPGQLNVVADKLSRLCQTIQKWSLLQEVIHAICSSWHQPQIDLFTSRVNNKSHLSVSPVPDPLATAVDALNLT